MKHPTSLRVAAALLLPVTLFSACATIAKGTTQPMTVSSNVAGATVLLDGVPVGTTPFIGPVAKNKGTLTVQKDGYESSTLALSKSLEPIFWGNIIIGGTLGSITDFATGAAYSYAPAAYQVDLKPVGPTSQRFEAEVAVRKFSMVHLDRISTDVAQGGGAYANALVSLLRQAGVAQADLAVVKDALAQSGGDAVQFGRAVVALL